MVQAGADVTVHSGQSGGRAGSAESATGGGDWRAWAGCRDVDPELFFPVGDSGPALVQVAQAKAVCARCPVVSAGLSFAVVALPAGVAGGLTARERRTRRVSDPPATGAPGFRRSAGGVDAQVVASLMAGHPVVGASPQELAQAAVGLARVGRGCRWIGTWLGVAERQVYRWLARYRAGEPLVGPDGRPGRPGRRGRVSA